jgi:hypothetical protein
MALFTFDYYDQTNVPTFSLVNPDGTVLFSLGTIYDRKLELRYNTLSKLTFTAPSHTDGVASDYYDYLQYRRLVYVDGVANFMISGIETENDGVIELKHITCESLETVLNYKKLTLFQGYYFFYKPETPTRSLLDNILAYIPGWTLGTIDTELMSLNRRFDVTDKTLYDFLTNEVAQTFQCVFVFDSINKTISAYTVANATSPTDIYISFENLMQSFVIQESTAELVTALNVLGGDDLSINTVNPLGTNTIYNFDYYKTTRWMTQDLIDALNTWEAKLASYQPTYASNLTQLKNATYELSVYQINLTDLESELVAANTAKDALLQAGQSLTDIEAQILSIELEIVDTQNNIVAQQSLVDNYRGILTGINTALLFQNNFTATQLSSLDNFIIGNTYTNTNFISGSSAEQTQEQAQFLYDQARGAWDSGSGIYVGGVISKVSQPRYTFDIESANFLFIKDFEPFIAQLSLGATITIQLNQ